MAYVRPCGDCPFLRSAERAPLAGGDAWELADFVQRGNVGICHSSKREKPCRGAVLFVAGTSAAVFATAEEMEAAHEADLRPKKFELWGVE